MKSVTVLGLVLLLAVAGCSSNGGDDETPRPLPSADQKTELTVVVSDGEGNDETFTIKCDPADGTHPRPESACEFLELAAKWGEDPFAPVPEDAVCTQIYGAGTTQWRCWLCAVIKILVASSRSCVGYGHPLKRHWLIG